MVRVPTYVSNVSLRPSYRQGIQVQATPAAFGADTGRGLQQLGQGMGQAAEAAFEVQQLDDMNRAKEADNAYADWARERMYGEGGFMTLEGRNAVEARAKFEEEAEMKRREIGSGLTPGAARAYEDASTARLQSISQSAIVHAANARKQWFNDATTARLNTFAEDAVAAYADPGAVNTQIALGQAEIREQARMLGWDADTLKNRETEYVSSIRMNTALRMMADDPVAADKYYKDHKDQITGPHQFEFEKALEVPLTKEKVLRHTNEFFTGAAGNDYYASIRAAESGGDDSARNPRSSATGRYQFTVGTWGQVARDHPELGLTPGGITDPAQQELAIRAFTEDNAKHLAKRGINVNNGTLYAAHFLGAGDAVKVLRSDPSASLTDILSAKVIEANPFLREMLVSDFAKWASDKGGGGGATVPSMNNVEAYLSSIEDPTEREMTRKSIYARMDAQAKMEQQRQEAVTAQAYNLIETQNVNPFDLPPEIATQIGMDGMSKLMTYWDKRAAGRETETDPVLLHDMQMLYATDPAKFAETDLFQYKTALSDEDWKTVSGWKETALRDQRKAREDGLNLTTAFSQAQTQLDAVGITTTGTTGRQREDAARRIAQFQNALAEEMSRFQEVNGSAPTQADIQSMTNRLLLPIVIKEDGWFGQSETEGFAFEAGLRPDGSEVEVTVEYVDIPIDLRRGIARDLEIELGREPSEEEIVARYEEVALSR